ncbi:MAG: SRPBCC family protein [Anaerolineae bacterium]|nr:SRPBCC family protein [Anaerolineae bacterium]
MAIIDQRILIPARQEVVWAYVSDFNKNAEWQADCQGVSFLSTRHDGVGARWRSTTDRGKDTVLEITSWYNGLGYEYAVVDGVALKNTKGRLRLQEIPEGTVVQWTFSFDGGGVLGGGRTARQYDSIMAASLKSLYKQIKAISQSDEIAARSLIREAPDVEARASYVPRHPSAADATVDAEPAEDAVLLPAASEPNVDAQDAGLVAAIDLSSEPPVTVEDTKPRPVAEVEPASDERFAPKPEPVDLAAEPEPATVEAGAATPEPNLEPAATEPPPDRTAAAVAAAAAAAALPPADAHGKSIWEVFGVGRPSAEAEEIKPETAERPPVEVAPEAAPAEAVEAATEAVTGKTTEPDPQETLPLEAVPQPAAAIPAVTVAALATVIAAVPDGDAAAEPTPSPAPPATAPAVGLTRQGLRLVQRRAHVNLRRPG